VGAVPHDGDGDGQPDGGRLRVPARGRRPERADDLIVWIALGADTALAVVDALTPVVLINLLVFGPLVAAFRARPRTTALVAVYAVGLALYEGIPHGIFGSSDHLVRCAAIAATGVVAVWGSWQRAGIAGAEARTALLTRAGAVLRASPRYDHTLPAMAALLVPAAADRVAVDLVVDGRVRRVAATAAVPVPDRTADDAVAHVVRTGEPALLDGAAVLPLRARGETVGALTIASASRPPAPGSAALAFAEELAAECAVAVDNARLHAELQASEEALRRSNDQLGAILGGVADGVLARDAAGQVVCWTYGCPGAHARRHPPARRSRRCRPGASRRRSRTPRGCWRARS
jgi:hypothetical protein